jgi:diguanylate cyclase (GGDEF)-like protein
VSPSAILLPWMSFDEACRRVVGHLKREVPLAFWAVSRVENGKQIYISVADDTYGTAADDSVPWSDTFCRHMVTGAAPQIAPDAMAVPAYAATRAAREQTVGAYAGVPIRGADDKLYGTICGIDPHVASQKLAEHAPLLDLCASLLGQILQAENLRAEAVDREAKLHWSAFHDDLTGLPNRALFFDSVGRALDTGSREGPYTAVLLIDLDEFKAVNDTLGHAAGDELLRLVAHRLRRSVRPGDTVARLSGDEFAVLLEDAPDPAIVAERLVHALTEPYHLAQRTVTISASIGVAEIARNGVEGDPEVGVEAVLARADVAMYTAKRAGKGRHAVYDPLMSLPGTTTLQLREPLRQALALGAIEAHYQPIVDLRTGSVIGFETLARWRLDGRYVQPAVFIPIATRSGLMPALTDHMLRLACTQVAAWSSELGHSRLRVSVNVSPHVICDPAFPDRVAPLLRHHGLAAGQLALEITEDALLHNLPTAVVVARRLRELGVVMSLDDFGAGYTSLAHLRQIPLDTIKIDRGFAGDVDATPDTEQFLRALLALGRDLELRVVVEGVERQTQVDVLRRIGGTLAQGYLFGRPVPARDVRLDRVDAG